MVCNAELCPNYFSVNVSELAVLFCQRISKNRQSCLKLLFFWEIAGEIQQLARKRSQKIIYDVILFYISLQEYLISESNNNSYHDGVSAFSQCFFRNRPTP